MMVNRKFWAGVMATSAAIFLLALVYAHQVEAVVKKQPPVTQKQIKNLQTQVNKLKIQLRDANDVIDEMAQTYLWVYYCTDIVYDTGYLLNTYVGPLWPSWKAQPPMLMLGVEADPMCVNMEALAALHQNSTDTKRAKSALLERN